MKLYTRTGDRGKTSVMNERLHKHDLLIEVLGLIDELNSFVGSARTTLEELEEEQLNQELLIIQHALFDCGTELSTKKEGLITEELIDWLERRIDAWSKQTPPLKRFILPGGTKSAAALHLCRTGTRKVERNLSQLKAEKNSVSDELQAFTNRLSDYFFAIARVANHLQQVDDIEYVMGKSNFTSQNKGSED